MVSTEEVLERLSTLADYIRWAASRFDEAGLVYGHGTDNALDEARFMVLATLHRPFDLADVDLNSTLTLKERQRLVDRLQRRITQRIPAPYLVGEAWFAGLPFYVDETVLIPRSPIAELIETDFAPWIEADRARHVLDLCTGSGCIAVACARAFLNCKVDAVDTSSEALCVAQRNIERHHVEDRIQLMQSDLFEGLAKHRYDIVISNPPYVDAAEMVALPPEYQHEPHVGLAGGEDGLDIVRRILKSAHHYLAPDGILIVEVGNSQGTLVEHYPGIPFLWLELERGGQGVFLLTAQQLEHIQEYVRETERV